ncbi:MAG TPA: class I SAM-dependent methyltransferase [Acidimicrobiales bacterium]|nr:class I SAM-dependent methyltransferase [Acidimicrobiales bacterium]
MSAPPRSREAQRSLLARHLAGDGIELGPGHVPFPVPYPGIRVRYVDRWQPDENRALFRELGDEAPFPMPDIVCNFDTDGLRQVDDASQDFVIASHVLEHVANPLSLLDEIHRVLRPGGVVLLLLPDRRRTFDRRRAPTPLAHVVDEHLRGITSVDDHHVADFLVGTDVPIPDDEGDRVAVFDLHRRRSIHVHCWQEDEFFEVLEHAVAELAHRWELVDAVLADDEGDDGFEFGYVLRRTAALDDAGVLAERLRLSWQRWLETRSWWHGCLAAGGSTAPPEPAAACERPGPGEPIDLSLPAEPPRIPTPARPGGRGVLADIRRTTRTHAATIAERIRRTPNV